MNSRIRVQTDPTVYCKIFLAVAVILFTYYLITLILLPNPGEEVAALFKKKQVNFLDWTGLRVFLGQQ
jgi:hypothetical protein